MEETRNKYGVCMGKALRNRLPERLKRRSNDNIKVDLKQIGCENGRWTQLPQGRDQYWPVVSVVMTLEIYVPPANELASTAEVVCYDM
jgi:hypothetical protein